MHYILGVDGGGTKTVVRIADVNGVTVSEYIAGAGNYKKAGMELAEKNITGGVLGAIKQTAVDAENIFFSSACFGLSGLDSEQDEQIYKKMIFDSQIKKYIDLKKTIICNDSRVGLAAGSDSKNGIMIICGTGSNCFGINEEGREAKANGWDYILGDEGSAYDIGIRALRAVTKAHDGRGRKTLLSKTILNELKLDNVTDLIDWCYKTPFSCERFADLTKVVCKTAELGDIISIRLLKDEAKEALASIDVVAGKLNFKDREFDIVFVGSVFRCEKYFRQVLTDKLKKTYPKIKFAHLNDKPVSGAIKMALKNL